MIESSKTESIGSMINYGMVGGGEGSFIGDVHRRAIGLDGMAQLVAGCFSRSAENNAITGKKLNISDERVYADYKEMASAEAKRADGINFVSIVTPNKSHFEIAKEFLNKGINVVCDKPLTTTSAEADELTALAREKDLLFCVTYTYTGYPAVKEARNLIKEGAIGDIRFINAEYPQEWLAEPTGDDNKQAAWRTDPKQSGISNCVGDIGSHIENLAYYITGQEIETLAARLDKIVDGRLLDDNATIMLEYKGGAKGLYWCSQIAWGSDNGLSIRIYGTTGSIEWHQEDPNYLKLVKKGSPVQILSRGRDTFSDHASSLIRLPSGHPEGYLESFANIYKTYIAALTKKQAAASLTADELDFPTPAMGAQGVRFIEKCVESSRKNAAWVNFQD
ncbi:MAG: Gfo/Idh/MocA family oxidoreductase [Spirochaetales bacterium]|nr:Gfo/Idh/MocA family oxidoreductase [Spirochaetales bacterium]